MSEGGCSKISNVLKLGVIGCGWVTEHIKSITKNIENIEIIAATDLIIERTYKVVNKEHSYNNAEKMYQKEDLDAVYIATPHHLHESMIKQALEYGKHVICEKPVAHSVKSARNILAIVKKHPNLKVGFNYQYRYDSECATLVSGIKKGHLGRIYYANCDIYFSRTLEYFTQALWRAKIETAGGGTLLTQGSHIIDILIWALGEPISVIGKVDNLKFKEVEVEDIGFGIVEFDNKCYVQVNSSMITKPRKKRINEKIELNIFGELGSCYYEGPWPLSYLKWFGVEDSNLSSNKTGLSDYGECYKAFANWILFDKPFYNTVEESSKVLLLTDALYKSSKSEKKEKIEKL